MNIKFYGRYCLHLCILVVCMLTMLPVFAQIKLTGTVKDSNGPLSGVTIQVKGNPTTGTATNQEGIFQITVQDKDILVFKMVGYAP